MQAYLKENAEIAADSKKENDGVGSGAAYEAVFERRSRVVSSCMGAV